MYSSHFRTIAARPGDNDDNVDDDDCIGNDDYYKNSLPTIDFATCYSTWYSTWYSDFLLQPYKKAYS